MKKQPKPKDRFDEIKNELIRHMGILHEQTRHDTSLVAEQVAGKSQQITEIKEEISKLTEMVDMLRFDLKLKADNLELITLSRRVALLEKRMVGRK